MATANQTGTTGAAGTAPAAPTYPRKESREVWIKRRYTKPILPEEDMLENSSTNYKVYLGAAYAGFGSSVLLGRTIWDDEEQEKKIMSQIIGVSPTSQEWDTALNKYWKNFLVSIPFEGKKLEAGVEHISDTVYRPLNVEDYVIYRYAIKHGWVANSRADVNKSKNIMFFIWDAKEEQRDKMRALAIKDKAYAVRMEVSGDYTKGAAVIQIGTGKTGLSPDDLKLELAAFSTEQPAKFLKIAQDADLMDKAFIETAVFKGIFIRPVNSTIIIYENTPIGNNLDEAVAWLRNSANAATKSIVEAKVKSK